MPTNMSIAQDVRDQLYWDVRVDSTDVTVNVENGRVELKGVVPTYRAMRAAVNDAWSVPGVTVVDNDLRVRYPVTISVPTDVEIADRVRNAIVWHPDLALSEIGVSVVDGWVTLTGSVDTYYERSEAEETAGDILGVMGITNNLTVSPDGAFVDDTIESDIRRALDRNALLADDPIAVEVEEGEVTLTGTVDTWAEKDAAYCTACCTPGVIDVEDRLVVLPG